MSSLIDRIVQFNELAGNAKGNLNDPNFSSIASQIHLISEEHDELMEAYKDYDEAMMVDGACDLIVVAVGLMHKMGVSITEAMSRVCSSNESKFCRNAKELMMTLNFYNDELGINTRNESIDGSVIAVVSDEDQYDINDKFYPNGKILKSINYQDAEQQLRELVALDAIKSMCNENPEPEEPEDT